MKKQERLFLPLKGEAFDWFTLGEKKYELRRYQHRFNEVQIKQGKPIEIRKGYSGQAFWGLIGSVRIGNSLEALFKEVNFKQVIPTASSLSDAINKAAKFVGSEGPFILFEVILVNYMYERKIRKYTASQLKLSEKYFDLVLSKKKVSTIRNGYIFFTNNIVPLISNNNRISVRILKLDYSKTFGSLDDEDALKDGFSSLEELKSALKKFYTDIDDDSPVTIIYFEMEHKNAD